LEFERIDCARRFMNRYFTFLYVRRDNAGMRTFRVHRTVAIVLAVSFLALIGSATVVLCVHMDRVATTVSLEKLKRENEALKALVDRYQSDREELRKQMAVSFDLHNRARLLASLEPISNDVWQVGVGGPDPSLNKLETAYPDSLFNDLTDDLGAMVRQSKLELQSYHEVIDVLDKERDVRESTPAVRPLRGGFVSSRFGRRMDPFTGEIVQHTGVDFRARTGSPIVSTASGIVARTGRDGGYGIMIEIDHGNGFKTRYAHLSKVLVHRGQRVKRGEIIGLVGNTGRSTGSHLHYEVLFRKVHRDPLQYVIPAGISYD
jgi:murein DD-endopeptidase MepM/ murein hydrolase activator NlpD